MEPITFSLIASALLLSSIRFGNMSDKKKIEKIFEYTGVMVKGLDQQIKHPKFIRKKPIDNGMEYVYRLPLGMPYAKLEHLNNNIGVFQDGLHKNVEIEFDGGMVHVFVYETDLPKKWDYEDIPLEGWNVQIGKTFKELMLLDFDKTPHLVGGGTTRYGKTNLIKVIMASLILNHPKDVEIYLIDLKEGAEFYRYRNIKQVQGVAKNVKEAHAMLKDLEGQLVKRMIYFRHMQWNNIVDTPMQKRTFIIVDEAGDLVPEKFMKQQEKETHEECQKILARICRLGGAFGFRELFFSQYTTADVLPRQVKQNADAKICFRIPSGYASEVILGEGCTQGADLPNTRGRAMFKDGADIVELQVPLMSDKQMEDLLGPYYETERKDVTDETTREDPSEVIEIGDSQP